VRRWGMESLLLLIFLWKKVRGVGGGEGDVDGGEGERQGM